jgi:hypothetical protein
MAFIALAALEAVAVTAARNCTQQKTLGGIVQPLQMHLMELNKEPTRLCKDRGCKSLHPKIWIAHKIMEAPGGVFVHHCSSSKAGPQITNRDATTHLQWSWLILCNTLLR